MNDVLGKYKLHIYNDILFVYNFIVKMPPFYPINLSIEQNLRNLNKSDCIGKCDVIYLSQYCVAQVLTPLSIFVFEIDEPNSACTEIPRR